MTGMWPEEQRSGAVWPEKGGSAGLAGNSMVRPVWPETAWFGRKIMFRPEERDFFLVYYGIRDPGQNQVFTVAPLWACAHESDLMSVWPKTDNWFWLLFIHYLRSGGYGDLRRFSI